MQTESLQTELSDRLGPHGSEGARTYLSGVVDLKALEDGRYEEVLTTVDDRLTQTRYSLISMLVAGIYFGVLIGFWLVDFSGWNSILAWSAPVGLVTVYGIYTTHQTAVQIRELSETRALLSVLVEQTSTGDDSHRT